MTRIPGLDQTPDQLQILDNKFRLGERNAYRRGLQDQLRILINNVGNDVQTVVCRLHELGFATVPGFEAKKIDEVIVSIRQIIDVLETNSRGIIDINGDEYRARIRDLNSQSGLRDILETITENEYFDVGSLNAALQSLPTQRKLEIPEEEKSRLARLMPRALHVPAIEQIEKLRTCSRFNTPPMAMQLPAKILVDGSEVSFTIEALKQILDEIPVTRDPLSRLKIGDIDSSKVFKKTWQSELTFWSISGIVNSMGLSYENQLAHQQKVLGENSKMGADAILAFLMRYLASKKPFMHKDFLRLNDKRDDGTVLEIYMLEGEIRIVDSLNNANNSIYIGASFCVKPNGFI